MSKNLVGAWVFVVVMSFPCVLLGLLLLAFSVGCLDETPEHKIVKELIAVINQKAQLAEDAARKDAPCALGDDRLLKLAEYEKQLRIKLDKVGDGARNAALDVHKPELDAANARWKAAIEKLFRLPGQ